MLIDTLNERSAALQSMEEDIEMLEAGQVRFSGPLCSSQHAQGRIQVENSCRHRVSGRHAKQGSPSGLAIFGGLSNFWGLGHVLGRAPRRTQLTEAI